MPTSQPGDPDISTSGTLQYRTGNNKDMLRWNISQESLILPMASLNLSDMYCMQDTPGTSWDIVILGKEAGLDKKTSSAFSLQKCD